MPKVWVFPGSFDPVTRGHEDLIRRAAALCDQLYVAVLINPDKHGFLPLKKRVELLQTVCADVPNAIVEAHNGEVVYLPARPELRDVSSSMVRQLAAFGGDITPFVPERCADLVKNYMAQRV